MLNLFNKLKNPALDGLIKVQQLLVGRIVLCL